MMQRSDDDWLWDFQDVTLGTLSGGLPGFADGLLGIARLYCRCSFVACISDYF